MPCTRNGSVLWGRVPGFTPRFAVGGRLLNEPRADGGLRTRHGVRVSRRAVEGLRRTYDVPMTLAALRRAYVERGVKIAPTRPGRAGTEAFPHARRAVDTVSVPPSGSAPHRPAPAHLDSIFTVKLLAVYTRRLTAPDRSFFLFGPRGTGKTTWLRRTFPDALWFDLVRDAEVVRLIRDPDVFRSEVEARSGSWVVVDEVQRHPPILNEVQDLIARHGRRYRYALTGSSARRLRREQANLLAARVVNRRFFPLTAAELGRDFDLEAALRWGTLPSVTSEPDERGKIDLLDAYVSNYIGQEIRLEAAVRRLDAFTRFLEIAALANGQVTNVSNIARDAAVARPTVQGYFETLVDTLLGTWLPAWRPRARVKEAGHPKFYFFDPGVVRALAGRLREPLERAERGPLLETYILHELRAWQDHAGCGGEFAYWGTPSQAEVDFVWTRARRAVGIEIKAVPRWRTGEARALADLVERGIVGRAYGVYEGRAALRSDAVEVLPVAAFLERLYAGEIIG